MQLQKKPPSKNIQTTISYETSVARTMSSTQNVRQNGSQYQCRPLDVALKQIRVLRVQPGSHSEQVAALVEHVSLEQTPVPTPYEAISYVWSVVKGTSTVSLDGEDVIVSAAAEEALKAMRYRDRERVLWIDAICINQNDLQERGRQVALMGDVYSKASQSLIWLGKADERTSKAIAGLETIHQQLSEETDGGRNFRKVLYGKAYIFEYSTVPLPEGLDFDAIKALFRRPWFRRRWVVQESALARKGVFYCGEFSMDMLQLFRASCWIHHKQHTLSFDLDAEAGIMNASYMSRHVDHDQGYFTAEQVQDRHLADLFRSFQTFDVTESRDFVYALLGLSRWASTGLPDLLKPDYLAPLEKIFTNAARMAIYESADLWLFRYIDHGPEFVSSPSGKSMPSWVPSLFHKLDLEISPNYFRSTFKANRGMARTIEKYADDSKIDLSNSILSVGGLAVDVVTDVGNRLDPDKFEIVAGIAEIVYDILICRTLRKGKNIAALEKMSFSDLGLVLVGGSNFDPELNPTEAGDAETSIFSRFLNGLSSASKNAPSNGRDAVLMQLNRVLEDATFSRCVWAIKYACMNRRLFATENGYVGLGPQATRTGDHLTVLSDSRMPMVLRQASGTWDVLGPCYVHGVMQGEAVRGHLESGYEIPNFALR